MMEAEPAAEVSFLNHNFKMKNFKCMCLFTNTPAPKLYTGYFEIIFGVLTTCHTQYTLYSSMQLHRWIKKFSKFSIMMCGVQQLCISPLGAQVTKMAANGSEKAFCVLTFHECRSVTIVQRQFRTKFGERTAI